MKQIEQLNAKYQTEKKEQQLKLQATEITKKLPALGIDCCYPAYEFAGFNFYRKRQALE